MTKQFLLNCIDAWTGFKDPYHKRMVLVCKTKLLIQQDKAHS